MEENEKLPPLPPKITLGSEDYKISGLMLANIILQIINALSFFGLMIWFWFLYIPIGVILFLLLIPIINLVLVIIGLIKKDFTLLYWSTIIAFLTGALGIIACVVGLILLFTNSWKKAVWN